MTAVEAHPWQTPEDPDALPRRIEWVPLDQITEDPANPKAHDEDLIGASVERHGVIDLMTRDDRTGYLISGHGRLSTLRARHAAGAEPPPGVQVTADGTWLAPVVVGWASKDDLDARAALITLNRTTELGGWVDDSLLQLLQQLRDADSLTGVGYDDSEIETLRRKLEAQAAWSGDAQHMLDEFRGITGQEETGYTANFSHKVVVYFQTDEDLAAFQQRNGIERIEKNRLGFPLGWLPKMG